MDRVKEVLNGIVERFKSGDIPEAVAFSCFPVFDVPSSKWSIINRTIMYFAGSTDARGFRQWQEVGRWVKQGAKAFHILVPLIYKRPDDSGNEKAILKGFRLAAVFRFEDTEGKVLEHQSITLPTLPLMDKAQEWGVNVKAISGNYNYYGYYAPKRSEIGLATPEECVFFHELSHAAHDKVKGGLKAGQDPLQEVVADLSAQALCYLVGKQADKVLGNTFRYIAKYAAEIDLSAIGACLRVMNEVEQVLNCILKGSEYVQP